MTDRGRRTDARATAEDELRWKATQCLFLVTQMTVLCRGESDAKVDAHSSDRAESSHDDEFFSFGSMEAFWKPLPFRREIKGILG
jgi:hypothetical protein